MPKLISPEDMLKYEKLYFESGEMRSIDMMEHAAKALADAALEYYPDARRIFIACGPGGNGGDGYACARLLHAQGRECVIYASQSAKSPDAVENAARARACGIEIREEDLPCEETIDESGLRRDVDIVPDLWIDCLFGTGFSRDPEGCAAKLIYYINRHRSRGAGVISADIPSGLNGRTGKASRTGCVQANHTITFHLAKYGCFLQDGPDFCGEIHIAPLPFPDGTFHLLNHVIPDLSTVAKFKLRQRSRNTHKGNFGHLLIIAGSVGMAGAAALCARAALRSGAGLVSIACPEEIVPILQIQAPCAMCIPLPQENGAISEAALSIIHEALKGKSAVAIGPGLSRKASPEILKAVLKSRLPAVIDADALNLLSENPELRKLLNVNHVLTPHPGEARRLLDVESIEDPVSSVQALTKTGANIVLKGASRVIARGDTLYISTSGCCGMARGGSGDIFTGLLGGMLAYANLVSTALIYLACEIHGKAGELAQEKYGSYAMNAADIIEFLPEVFKRYAK